MRSSSPHSIDETGFEAEREHLPDVFLLVHESRSGSTFLADVLSRHPEISIAPESSLLRNVWRWRKSNPKNRIATKSELEAFVEELFREEKLQAWGIDPASVIQAVSPHLPVPSGYVARMIIVEFGRSRHPGSSVFGLKRGGWNVFNLASVRILLPGVRYVHIVRDGRAVYASEKRAIHRHTGRPFQEKPMVAAWRWQNTVRSFDEGGEGLEVRYEELVRRPESVLSELLRYLQVDAGLSLVERMLRPHESEYVPDYVADLHQNVGKRPLVDRIDAWRNDLSKREIRAFERVAGDTLVEKGYPRATPRRGWDGIFEWGVNLQQRLDRLVGPRRWRKSRMNP